MGNCSYCNFKNNKVSDIEESTFNDLKKKYYLTFK